MATPLLCGDGVQWVLFAAIDMGWPSFWSGGWGFGTVEERAHFEGNAASREDAGRSAHRPADARGGFSGRGWRYSGSASRELPGFLGLIVATALMSASFGLMLAALGKTPQAARGIAIFAVLLMVMLGGAGCRLSSFRMAPEGDLAVPTRWAVDGFDAVTWRGAGIESAMVPSGSSSFLRGLRPDRSGALPWEEE